MTDDALKAAVREAYTDYLRWKYKDYPEIKPGDEFIDKFTSALARRGVVVAGGGQREALATLRKEFDNAKYNENLDSYDDLLNAVDRILTLTHLLDITSATGESPAPIFEIGKRYRTRGGWIATVMWKDTDSMAMRAVHNDNGLTRSHSKDGVPIHAGLPYALLPGAIDDDAPEIPAPKPARKVEFTPDHQALLLTLGRIVRAWANENCRLSTRIGPTNFGDNEVMNEAMRPFDPFPGCINETPISQPEDER
jgi:hypothetical protein